MKHLWPILRKGLAIGVLITLVGLAALPVGIAAQADDYESAASTLNEEAAQPTFSASSSAVRNAYLLLRLKQYLTRAEQNYQSLQEKMDETRGEIDEARYTIDTLEGQVDHLGYLTEQTADKIYNVQEQIAEKELDIEQSLETIAFHEVQIEDQERALSDYLRLLYFEKNLNYDSSNQANGLKVLLQKGTISSVLQSGTYIAMMEQQSEEILDELQTLERTVRRENFDLTLKRNDLADLEEELEGEYRNLEAQLEGKQNLLDQTKDSDEIYRELYASYKMAQEAILDEINMFQENISALDERILNVATEADLEAIDLIQSEAGEDWSLQEAADFVRLDWPVSPKMGLTAFYDDAGYAQQFGVTHHALDVRIPHNSLIYAPADAVVYRVNDTAALDDEDARLGYGYIILAHRMGVMTLFGHVSGALVQEGDYVHRGQMIGLTGGVPGMPGSGVRTTGAHLHFEVIQDGIRVDPLEYLPLEEVPFDSLPERYLHMLEEQLEAELAENGVDAEDIEFKDREEGEIVVDETIFETEGDFWTQGEL